MKKRILSMLLSVCMLSSLIVLIPTINVEAVETITDEALFMTYPTYLSNSEMDEGLSKAEAAYHAVLNSYSTTDEAVAAFMSAMSEGVSLAVKDTLGSWGIGETLYDEYAKAAATKYMQSMLFNENAVKKATKKVNNAYKTLKTSYNIASSVDKSLLLDDLRELAKTYDVNISVEGMDKVVNKLYDAGALETDLDAIGEAAGLWKYVLEITELHAVEMTAIQLLIDELTATGQTDSDLYLGLTLLKEEIELNQDEYVLKKYSNSKIVSYISKNIDKFFYNLVDSSAITVAFVTTFCKVYADYIYADAKADELIQATMQTSFISSIDICLSRYRTKFLQGAGTTEDIETYENLYAAYLSAYKACLDSCYDVAKLDDKYTLGGDCMVWADEIEYTYTYDTYIRWCKEEVAHDIENATLDQNTGSSIITDELNEETIKSRFERIYKLYPPNSDKKFIGEYDGAKHSIGFVAKVFSMLFDKQMSNKVESKYNYILTSNKNVRVVGRLEEEDVTEDALKELFSNARIGDVVLTSGQYDYFQGMILTNVTDTGIEVYDCDSKYGAEKDDYYDLIQQYELTYEWMADAFSKNGEYHSKPGISIYRAIRKISSVSSDNSLNNEEYDDSVNYVIEDGVLTSYNGSRTTIEIPDGVTDIAAKCFKDNTSIKYVYMPNTITQIGRYAFENCSNLKHVNLSSALSEIGGYVFKGCTSLTGIAIPNGVKHIDESAFYACSSLVSIALPKNTSFYKTLFSSTAFYNNESNWENNTLYLDNYLIETRNTKPDLSFLIKEDITHIVGGAFSELGLTSITIPDNVTSIGLYAFNGCDALTEINIGKGVTSIGNQAFSECTALKKMYINATITTEEIIASSSGDNLDVIFGNGVTAIPAYIFNGCTGLKNIVSGDNVNKIGANAFSNCTNLETITIGNSVSCIGYRAFSDCPNLKKLYWNSNASEVECLWSYDGTYLGFSEVIVGNNVNKIQDGIFGNFNLLTHITLPSNVESVGDSAFYGCDGLKKVEMSDKIAAIGDSAFAYCNALTNIELPESLIKIGNNAFQGCTEISNISFGKKLTEIGTEAFSSCTSLATIEIPINVTKLGTDMFKGCTSLKKATINTEEITAGMFDNCSALSDITLGRQIKSIDIWAFRNTAISDITLPASLNTIHPGAFINCSKLGMVEILNPLVGFTSHTFESCSKELVIKGYTGSSAEYNAKYYGLEFESIGDVPQIPFTNVIAQWTGSGYDVNISQLNADSKTYIITAYDFEGKPLSTKIGVLSDMYTSRSFYYEFGEISGFKVMIWNTLSDMIPITSVSLCQF